MGGAANKLTALVVFSDVDAMRCCWDPGVGGLGRGGRGGGAGAGREDAISFFGNEETTRFGGASSSSSSSSCNEYACVDGVASSSSSANEPMDVNGWGADDDFIIPLGGRAGFAGGAGRWGFVSASMMEVRTNTGFTDAGGGAGA